MNQYMHLKERHLAEFNDFPMFFAFSDKQFREQMEKWGLDSERDLDKVVSLPYGGFIQKKDADRYREMIERHYRELSEAIAGDKTGDGFICDMFNYELGNHEYTYTWDVTDAVESLGFTLADVQRDERLLHGLSTACKEQREWFEKNG